MTRTLLSVLGLLLPSLCMGQQARKLNVVLICADDHAPYVVGAYGNKQVRTPNVDRLAAQGMRFNRAYCNAPVCTASRQSFFTGRYPRTLGVTQLRTPLPAGSDTLAHMLKRAGYVTAAIGKMHFNSNLKHGLDQHVFLPEHRQWLQKKGKQPLPEGVAVLPPWRPFKDPARVWLNSMCLPYAAVDEDMAGTFFARRAVTFLDENRSRPFFLIVSFTEPHSPFHFPVEYHGRHDPRAFAVPKVVPADEPQVPQVFRNLSERHKQGIIASYYTSVEFLDKNVGVVLDALDRLGLAEDTLVIYIGDHGYCLGHHGRFEKHCLFEVAVRAPLLMRWPGHIPPGQKSNALVEFIDLAPTILTCCQQPLPKSLQGKSLRQLVEGKVTRHRDKVVVEYSENEEALVRTERWAFVYGTGKRERQDGYATGRPLPGRTVRLYDCDKDPEQTTNLGNRGEYAQQIERFSRALAEHLQQTARQPQLLPRTDDVHALLEFCLQPRDVEP